MPMYGAFNAGPCYRRNMLSWGDGCCVGGDHMRVASVDGDEHVVTGDLGRRREGDVCVLTAHVTVSALKFLPFFAFIAFLSETHF